MGGRTVSIAVMGFHFGSEMLAVEPVKVPCEEIGVVLRYRRPDRQFTREVVAVGLAGHFLLNKGKSSGFVLLMGGDAWERLNQAYRELDDPDLGAKEQKKITAAIEEQLSRVLAAVWPSLTVRL